jgi:putative hemolysin
MAGCPKCGGIDFVRANPHKAAVVYPNGFTTFHELREGETLNLPEKWFTKEFDELPPSYFAALPHPDGVTPSKSVAALGAAAPGTVDIYRVVVRRYSMDPAQPKVPVPICTYNQIAELRFPNDEAGARAALPGMRTKWENPPLTLVALVVTTQSLTTGAQAADVVLYESVPRYPEGPCVTPSSLIQSSSSSMGNPASENCIAKGGKVEIVTDKSGGQSGYCVFPNGARYEEWALFRGEVGPGTQPATSGPSAGAIVAGSLAVAAAGGVVYMAMRSNKRRAVVREHRPRRKPRPRRRPKYAQRVGWHWDGWQWRGPHGERRRRI